MAKKSIISAVLVLALVTMACGLRVNLPVQEVNTGPTQTEEINVPVPDSSETADLEISFGAGELHLSAGAGEALVSGTATYNVPDLKPVVRSSGNSIRLTTGELEIRGIPNFGRNIKNEWDLELGDAPLNLRINAGAYQGRYELGGLSLTSLEISDGAADVRLEFSEPNRVEMSSLVYQTGASNVRLSGLANANFSSMTFRSGAGDYTLDFSGELQRDAAVRVESGISQVTIVVPDGVSAQVIFEGGLTNIETHSGWQRSGNTYTRSGSGPTVTIRVDMGAGSLDLR